MESQLERKRRVAPESIKTKRARDKLRKQWEAQDALITETALAHTIEKIHKWIAANPNRIPVKKKELKLFDQNKNAAELSSRVEELRKKFELEGNGASL